MEKYRIISVNDKYYLQTLDGAKKWPFDSLNSTDEYEFIDFCNKNEIIVEENKHIQLIKGGWRSTTYDQPDNWTDYDEEFWKADVPYGINIENVMRDLKLEILIKEKR